MTLQDQRQQRFERISALGCDILDESRIQLMLKFRFLDLALWRMELESVEISLRYPLATDGTKVYFDPDSVINRFELSFNETVRDYLHLIMHCIFRHPFDESHERHEAWWLACDIIAESAALELCGNRFPSDLDTARKQALSELRLLCGTLSPGRLYNLFVGVLTAPYGADFKGLDQSRLTEFEALFVRDDHGPWPGYHQAETEEQPGDIEELSENDPTATEQSVENDTKEMQVEGETSLEDTDQQQSNNQESDSQNNSEDDASGESSKAEEATDNTDDSDSSLESDFRGQLSHEIEEEEIKDEKSEEERSWEEIAKQVEVNLETFSKEWGEEAASFIAQLKVANRRKYDYSEFLKRFSLLSEEMKVNDDEYDNIFYTYGLQLYGNMPLIEPLEYKETQRIRDFVIAIDTSESCSGELVKRFIAHTFDILKNQEDFAHKINVHIIQCDAKVQADTKITDLRDVDSFMEGFYIRGLGGTDFRPVFGYVEDLRYQGELPDMKGLIYFTDGLGRFPEAAPDFDTAFVFLDDGESYTPSVPPWAMKILIDEEGINRFKNV